MRGLAPYALPHCQPDCEGFARESESARSHFHTRGQGRRSRAHAGGKWRTGERTGKGKNETKSKGVAAPFRALGDTAALRRPQSAIKHNEKFPSGRGTRRLKRLPLGNLRYVSTARLAERITAAAI